MRIFQPSTRDNSHNILASFSRMSAKSLWCNAPGGTRIPNLLIRSQMSTPTDAPSTYEIRTEAAIEIPKADKSSRNNSHNIAKSCSQDKPGAEVSNRAPGAVSFLSEGPR